MKVGGLPAEIALDIVERKRKPFDDARQRMEKSFLPLREEPPVTLMFQGRPFVIPSTGSMTTANNEHSIHRVKPSDNHREQEFHTLKRPNDGRPFGGMFYEHQTPYI